VFDPGEEKDPKEGTLLVGKIQKVKGEKGKGGGVSNGYI